MEEFIRVGALVGGITPHELEFGIGDHAGVAVLAVLIGSPAALAVFQVRKEASAGAVYFFLLFGRQLYLSRIENGLKKDNLIRPQINSPQ